MPFGVVGKAGPVNCLIVGASGGLGRALSVALAEKGHNLLLCASDERDLRALAGDLALRFNIRAEIATCSIRSGEPWLAKLVAAAAVFPHIDGLFFPIGFSSDDDNGTLDETHSRALVEANLLSVMLIVSTFLPKLIAQKKGWIVGFGSIAAVRGRRSNIIYSAAKRALASYFESLGHLLWKSGVGVQFYQMGYIDTQQSFGRRLLFPKCSPEAAAQFVVAHLNSGFALRNYPRFWSLITLAVRYLPWTLFKRLNF